MGRHAKGVTDTRAALVAAAWEQFGSVGFEAATVEGIIAKAGVSKGAFYHHFDSKMEILDAVAERMAAASSEPIRTLADDADATALEKLDRFLERLRSWKLANAGAVSEVGRLLHRPENLLLLHKIRQRSMATAAPALAAILRQGGTERSLSVRDADASARMVFYLVWGSTTGVMALLSERTFAPEVVAEVARQTVALLDAIERLIGARAGALRRPEAEAVEALCRRVAGDNTGGSHGER